MEQQTSASVNSLPQPPSPSEHNGQPGPTLEAKNHSLFPHIISRIFQPIFAVINPVTIALLIALPIALIQPLKALFVDVSSLGGPAWKGPDGRPPLAFMIDTGMSILTDLVWDKKHHSYFFVADFLGTITVPLALILLGASFARLNVPHPLSRLPIPAMIAVALAKMLILPIIGVFMVLGMVRGGLIDDGAKVEKFVAMFLSGTPAAVK